MYFVLIVSRKPNMTKTKTKTIYLRKRFCFTENVPVCLNQSTSIYTVSTLPLCLFAYFYITWKCRSDSVWLHSVTCIFVLINHFWTIPLDVRSWWFLYINIDIQLIHDVQLHWLLNSFFLFKFLWWKRGGVIKEYEKY